MQQEQMGGTLTMTGPRRTTIFDVPCETEVIVKMSGRSIRRGDYPCGCRCCREAAAANIARRSSSLAAIDVYDVPDEIDAAAQDYFH